jgi:hypothetical protein
MTLLRNFQLAILVVALTVTLSCGNSLRELVAMNLSPSVADAQNYPNGQVQFTASGTYNLYPLTGPVQPALWSIYKPQNTQNIPTITQNGLAQCGSAVGTFSVQAYAVSNPSASQTPQNLLTSKQAVLGLASLTCP